MFSPVGRRLGRDLADVPARSSSPGTGAGCRCSRVAHGRRPDPARGRSASSRSVSTGSRSRSPRRRRSCSRACSSISMRSARPHGGLVDRSLTVAAIALVAFVPPSLVLGPLAAAAVGLALYIGRAGRCCGPHRSVARGATCGLWHDRRTVRAPGRANGRAVRGVVRRALRRARSGESSCRRDVPRSAAPASVISNLPDRASAGSQLAPRARRDARQAAETSS